MQLPGAYGGHSRRCSNTSICLPVMPGTAPTLRLAALRAQPNLPPLVLPLPYPAVQAALGASAG